MKDIDYEDKTQFERFCLLVRNLRTRQKAFRKSRNSEDLQECKWLSVDVDDFLNGCSLDQYLKPVKPIEVNQGDFFND
jgi:hypothetical protein